MKSAGGGAPFTDASRADHARDAFEAAGHQNPINDRDHCAEMADHNQQSFFWAAPMNVAITRAHRPERRTQVSPHRIENGFAKGKTASRIPDQRRKDVALAQADGDRGTEGFLAATKINATIDFAHAIK